MCIELFLTLMKKNSKFKYIYNGIFKNYDQCLKKNQNFFYKEKNYEDKQKKIIKEIIYCLNKKKQIPSFYKQHTQHLINSISLLKKKSIKILDIGGGWGVGYANILESFSKEKILNIDYYNYDLDNVCNIGEIYFKKKLSFMTKKLRYIKDLNEVKLNKFDIIFFGSSLQYFKNPIKILEKILKIKTKYLIFIDLYLVSCTTFFTNQKHYESSVPHSFINKNKFLNLVSAKFHLVSSSYSHTMRLNKVGQINMKNFPKKYRIENSLNLFFIKK